MFLLIGIGALIVFAMIKERFATRKPSKVYFFDNLEEVFTELTEEERLPFLADSIPYTPVHYATFN
jgi:hypothetical protein